MSKVFLFPSMLAVLAIAVVLTGCSKKPEQQQQQSSTSPGGAQAQPTSMGHESHEGHELEGGSHAGHQPGEASHADHSGHTGHSAYTEALAELSSADRALAEKQKVCPVSGQALGSMGKPHKVAVNGREVFLCCPGCEGDIKENPDDFLAKLSQ